MAEITNRLAFFDLRDWWLSDPKVYELLEEPRLNKGQFADPFYPVSQQPEGGFPYARYTVSRTLNFPQWWMHVEQVGIDLYMMDVMDSSLVFNTFVDMASRGDESARELERWLDKRNADRIAANEDPIPRDFRFHSLEYMGGGDIVPADEEGGNHSRIMMFNISYSPIGGRDIA